MSGADRDGIGAPAPGVGAPPGGRIELTGSGRSGTVTWIDGDRRIAFWDEMATGPCPWIVGVPSPADWTAATGLPLAERAPVLDHVARLYALARGGSSWRWDVGEHTISFLGRT